jgi:15-cis-phytoene synthase
MIGLDEQLALAYAPPKLRVAFKALLQFDAALGQAFKATSTIGLTQIRLAWWRDQLAVEGAHDPLAAMLKLLINSYNISPTMFEAMIDGWAVLLDDLPYSDAQLTDYALGRGGGLFAIAAQMACVQGDKQAGAGWALVDFARHCSHPETANRAMGLARQYLGDNAPAKLSRRIRTFAILAHFAKADAVRDLNRQRAAGSPYRMIQAIGFVMFRR